MSRVELEISSDSYLRSYISSDSYLCFCITVGRDSRFLPKRLTNKDKVILHLLNNLRWKATFLDKDDHDHLYKHKITFEAVDPDEDVVKALKTLINIRGLKREESKRLSKLPPKDVCRELALKLLLS